MAIDQDQSVLMAIYASELIDSNKKINLATITDSAEVAEKNISSIRSFHQNLYRQMRLLLISEPEAVFLGFP